MKKPEPRSLSEWPLRGSSESCSTSLPHSKDPNGRQSVVSNVSDAQVFTKWLAKKSRKDGRSDGSDRHQMSGPGSPSSGSHAIGRGQLFPARLALALGMAKTLVAILLVAFGALALWQQASMAYLGSGLWSGAVVLVCGLLGIMAGQRRTNFVYIVSYLLVSVLSLAAMGLLLIFTATGLARDTGAPLGFFVDLEGERVDFLGTVPLRQRAVIINAVLVALGTLSTILSLAASVICLREACLCYGASAYHRRLVNSNSSCNSSHNKGVHRLDSVPNINLLAADQSPEGQARAYRLMRWLRQSHEHAKQQRPPVLFRRLYNPPVPVAVPVTVPAGQPAFPSFVTGAPTAYVIPAMIQPMIPGPPAFYSLASLPSLHSSGLPRGHSLPGPPHRPPTSLAHQAPRSGKKNKRTNTDEEAEQQVKTPRRRHQSCGTDEQAVKADAAAVAAHSAAQSARSPHQMASSDVESVVSGYVFTGMDREIPEELILHSMTIRHPASVHSTC